MFYLFEYSLELNNRRLFSGPETRLYAGNAEEATSATTDCDFPP